MNVSTPRSARSSKTSTSSHAINKAIVSPRLLRRAQGSPTRWGQRKKTLPRSQSRTNIIADRPLYNVRHSRKGSKVSTDLDWSEMWTPKRTASESSQLPGDGLYTNENGEKDGRPPWDAEFSPPSIPTLAIVEPTPPIGHAKDPVELWLQDIGRKGACPSTPHTSGRSSPTVVVLPTPRSIDLLCLTSPTLPLYPAPAVLAVLACALTLLHKKKPSPSPTSPFTVIPLVSQSCSPPSSPVRDTRDTTPSSDGKGDGRNSTWDANPRITRFPSVPSIRSRSPEGGGPHTAHPSTDHSKTVDHSEYDVFAMRDLCYGRRQMAFASPSVATPSLSPIPHLRYEAQTPDSPLPRIPELRSPARPSDSGELQVQWRSAMKSMSRVTVYESRSREEVLEDGEASERRTIEWAEGVGRCTISEGLSLSAYHAHAQLAKLAGQLAEEESLWRLKLLLTEETARPVCPTSLRRQPDSHPRLSATSITAAAEVTRVQTGLNTSLSPSSKVIQELEITLVEEDQKLGRMFLEDREELEWRQAEAEYFVCMMGVAECCEETSRRALVRRWEYEHMCISEQHERLVVVREWQAEVRRAALAKAVHLETCARYSVAAAEAHHALVYRTVHHEICGRAVIAADEADAVAAVRVLAVVALEAVQRESFDTTAQFHFLVLAEVRARCLTVAQHTESHRLLVLLEAMCRREVHFRQQVYDEETSGRMLLQATSNSLRMSRDVEVSCRVLRDEYDSRLEVESWEQCCRRILEAGCGLSVEEAESRSRIEASEATELPSVIDSYNSSVSQGYAPRLRALEDEEMTARWSIFDRSVSERPSQQRPPSRSPPPPPRPSRSPPPPPPSDILLNIPIHSRRVSPVRHRRTPSPAPPPPAVESPPTPAPPPHSFLHENTPHASSVRSSPVRHQSRSPRLSTPPPSRHVDAVVSSPDSPPRPHPATRLSFASPSRASPQQPRRETTLLSQYDLSPRTPPPPQHTPDEPLGPRRMPSPRLPVPRSESPPEECEESESQATETAYLRELRKEIWLDGVVPSYHPTQRAEGEGRRRGSPQERHKKAAPPMRYPQYVPHRSYREEYGKYSPSSQWSRMTVASGVSPTHTVPPSALHRKLALIEMREFEGRLALEKSEGTTFHRILRELADGRRVIESSRISHLNASLTVAPPPVKTVVLKEPKPAVASSEEIAYYARFNEYLERKHAPPRAPPIREERFVLPPAGTSYVRKCPPPSESVESIDLYPPSPPKPSPPASPRTPLRVGDPVGKGVFLGPPLTPPQDSVADDVFSTLLQYTVDAEADARKYLVAREARIALKLLSHAEALQKMSRRRDTPVDFWEFSRLRRQRRR